MKFDIYIIELGVMLSYLDPKFKGKTKCIPAIGDFIDYEILYKHGCTIIAGKVVDRIHYLQDDKVEVRVTISDEVLEDITYYMKQTGKI